MTPIQFQIEQFSKVPGEYSEIAKNRAQEIFDEWYSINVLEAPILFRMNRENGLEFWENQDDGGMSDAHGRIVLVQEK